MPAHRADGRAARAIAAFLALVGLLVAPALSAAALAPGETAAVTKVAIVVPVVAPPRAGGLIPADELAELTAPSGVLGATLDAVAGQTVTLAVDPLIAASVNALGADAPEVAVAWVRRLDRLPHERFMLLTADADPTLLRQAGAGLPALGTVWTTPGTVSATDLEAFAAAGARRVLVAETDLQDLGMPPTAVAAADGMGLRIVDSAASAALQAAADAPSATTLGAFRAAVGTGRDSLVAVLDRTGAGWPGLADTLAALRGDLGLQLARLSDLAGETLGVTLADGAQPPERLERATRLVDAERADAEFSAIMADAADFQAEQRLRTYTLAAVGWEADRAEWAVAVDAAVDASAALRAGVRIEETDSLFLADRSRIPITVVNELDRAVTVVVTARASDGRLDIDRAPVTVEIAAESRASVAFDAVAVSNGVVVVTARLTSTAGDPIGAPASARIDVQAGWETPIAAAAAGVLLLIVVLGIVRTVRRVRRARAGSRDA